MIDTVQATGTAVVVGAWRLTIAEVGVGAVTTTAVEAVTIAAVGAAGAEGIAAVTAVMVRERYGPIRLVAIAS
jgi:hypothetical protein